MTSLVDKIVILHGVLRRADIPHAFGGALALAWCTQRARGTIDIDVNVFVDVGRAGDVLMVLPAGVAWSASDLVLLERDGQARLWWDGTPLDMFLNTTPFHAEVGARSRWEPFGGDRLPFLACADLAVFKAFFNRSKDWVDLEEMVTAGALDIEGATGVLAEYLGADDDRIARLQSLKGARP